MQPVRKEGLFVVNASGLKKRTVLQLMHSALKKGLFVINVFGPNKVHIG